MHRQIKPCRPGPDRCEASAAFVGLSPVSENSWGGGVVTALQPETVDGLGLLILRPVTFGQQAALRGGHSGKSTS